MTTLMTVRDVRIRAGVSLEDAIKHTGWAREDVVKFELTVAGQAYASREEAEQIAPRKLKLYIAALAAALLNRGAGAEGAAKLGKAFKAFASDMLEAARQRDPIRAMISNWVAQSIPVTQDQQRELNGLIDAALQRGTFTRRSL